MVLLNQSMKLKPWKMHRNLYQLVKGETGTTGSTQFPLGWLPRQNHNEWKVFMHE